MAGMTGCKSVPSIRVPEPAKPSPSPAAVVAAPIDPGFAPEVLPKSTPTTTPAPTPTPSPALAAVQVTPPLPEGEFAILVESVPTGAMIVVNGIPVGRAPRRVVLPGTAQGFSRGTVSIKARFVAANSTQQSSTTEEEFTPLDRLPPGLVFTPDRVQRKR